MTILLYVDKMLTGLMVDTCIKDGMGSIKVSKGI